MIVASLRLRGVCAKWSFVPSCLRVKPVRRVGGRHEIATKFGVWPVEKSCPGRDSLSNFETIISFWRALENVQIQKKRNISNIYKSRLRDSQLTIDNKLWLTRS